MRIDSQITKTIINRAPIDSGRAGVSAEIVTFRATGAGVVYACRMWQGETGAPGSWARATGLFSTRVEALRAIGAPVAGAPVQLALPL